LFKIFYHCFVEDCKNWKAGTKDQPFTTLEGAIVTLAAGFVYPVLKFGALPVA
jgi:hypothetical protein